MNLLMILSTSLFIALASPISSSEASFEKYHMPKKTAFTTTINQVSSYSTRPVFMVDMNVIRDDGAIWVKRVLNELNSYEKQDKLFAEIQKQNFIEHLEKDAVIIN